MAPTNERRVHNSPFHSRILGATRVEEKRALNQGSKSEARIKKTTHRRERPQVPRPVQVPNPQVQQPATAAEMYHRQLRIGTFSSQIISRGFLLDLTVRSTPPAAMPYVERTLAYSKLAPYKIDVNEKETHLYFWDLDGNSIKSLKRDWVMLLSLVPHWLELMPGEVSCAFELEMTRAGARVKS